jgi:hypothetical protein
LIGDSECLMHLRLALIAFGMCAATAAAAQDLPPPGTIERIIPQLQEPLAAARISFRPKETPIDAACNMQPFEMTLARDDRNKPHQYSVLLNPQRSRPAVPRQMLAVINRLAVDADGAARAYHPVDVYGKGVCTRRKNRDGTEVLRGVCALDSFASSGIRIFNGAERMRFPNPSKQPKEAAETVAKWKDFWTLIRERKLPSIDFKAIGGPLAPEGYRMFYWKEEKLAAFFKRAIIPHTHDGYPCLHGEGSRYSGYFITATTLTQNSNVRPDGCAPTRYIDALEIPFFVLPGGSIGAAQLGDIVIGFYKSGRTERLAFGIAADAGPVEQFGEGSVAFNQILLGQTRKPVININDVNSFHISSERLKADKATLAILVLGGTKQQLNGDYSRANIEKIGRAELARWNGGGANMTARLNACIRRAKP